MSLTPSDITSIDDTNNPNNKQAGFYLVTNKNVV